MTLAWLCVGVAAVVLELVTPTALVCIWFALGSIIAAVLAYIGLTFEVQVVGFASISIVSMLIVRPIASRYFRGNRVATNADRWIGEITVLTSPITSDKWGEVILNGISWSAVSINKEPINQGEKVKVLAIEGAKLIVKKIS